MQRVINAENVEALERATYIVLRRPALQRVLAQNRRLISHLNLLAVEDSHTWHVASTRLLCALGHYPRAPVGLGRGRPGPRPLSPGVHGVRVLALDGGGTRALLTIEMLKSLEAQTGKRVHELFDVIGGTSTGGILAAGIQEQLSLETLEALYLELAKEVFVKVPRPRRYGQLLLTGATYKAHALEQILKRVLPRSLAEDCNRKSMGPETMAPADTQGGTPSTFLDDAASIGVGARGHPAAAAAAATSAHGAAVPPSWFDRRLEQERAFLASMRHGRRWLESAALSPPAHAFVVTSLTSRAPPVPYLLRNYEYGPRAIGRHGGTSLVPLWQALRATTAAPSYFAEVLLQSEMVDGGLDIDAEAEEDSHLPSGKLVLQDGALLANNPAAIALQEARALYPGVPIACLASFGTGSFAPSVIRKPGAWATTVDTLVRAATRTEEVHEMLSDILPNAAVPYFRFNPEIPAVSLDETSPLKLRELQGVGRDFMNRGPALEQCTSLSKLLLGRRGAAQRLSSWRAKVFSKLGSGMAIARSRL